MINKDRNRSVNTLRARFERPIVEITEPMPGRRPRNRRKRGHRKNNSETTLDGLQLPTTYITSTNSLRGKVRTSIITPKNSNSAQPWLFPPTPTRATNATRNIENETTIDATINATATATLDNKTTVTKETESTDTTNTTDNETFSNAIRKQNSNSMPQLCVRRRSNEYKRKDATILDCNIDTETKELHKKLRQDLAYLEGMLGHVGNAGTDAAFEKQIQAIKQQLNASVAAPMENVIPKQRQRSTSESRKPPPRRFTPAFAKRSKTKNTTRTKRPQQLPSSQPETTQPLQPQVQRPPPPIPIAVNVSDSSLTSPKRIVRRKPPPRRFTPDKSKERNSNPVPRQMIRVNSQNKRSSFVIPPENTPPPPMQSPPRHLYLTKGSIQSMREMGKELFLKSVQ